MTTKSVKMKFVHLNFFKVFQETYVQIYFKSVNQGYLNKKSLYLLLLTVITKFGLVLNYIPTIIPLLSKETKRK